MFSDVLGGLPYEGVPMTLRDDDPPEKRPQILSKAFIKTFSLDKPEDRELLEKTLRDVHNMQLHNAAAVSKLEYQYDESLKSWVVLLVWLEYYSVSPEEAKDVIEKARKSR